MYDILKPFVVWKIGEGRPPNLISWGGGRGGARMALVRIWLDTEHTTSGSNEIVIVTPNLYPALCPEVIGV